MTAFILARFAGPPKTGGGAVNKETEAVSASVSLLTHKNCLET